MSSFAKERNKKSSQNIIYWLTPITKNNILCQWQYEKQYFQKKSNIINRIGFVNREFVKKLLSENQWKKFCQGEIKFIIQK